METELLVQADRLVGGSDAVLVIDDTAIAKNDFLPPSPPSPEGQRPQRSGRAILHQRWGQELRPVLQLWQ
jgi:hypothetical protein